MKTRRAYVRSAYLSPNAQTIKYSSVLNARRVEIGLPLDELYLLTDLSTSSLNRVLNGQRWMAKPYLDKLLQALDITMDEVKRRAGEAEAPKKTEPKQITVEDITSLPDIGKGIRVVVLTERDRGFLYRYTEAKAKQLIQQASLHGVMLDMDEYTGLTNLMKKLE